MKLWAAFLNIMTVMCAVMFLVSAGSVGFSGVFAGIFNVTLFGRLTRFFYTREREERRRLARKKSALRRRAAMAAKTGRKRRIA